MPTVSPVITEVKSPGNDFSTLDASSGHQQNQSAGRQPSDSPAVAVLRAQPFILEIPSAPAVLRLPDAVSIIRDIQDP
jgi:hypothetical protein